MVFLRSQVQAPKTFGELAKRILAKLQALAERIDFVCNTYTSPSIKDLERYIRESHNVRFLFKITCAEQICSKDFQEAMSPVISNHRYYDFWQMNGEIRHILSNDIFCMLGLKKGISL